MNRAAIDYGFVRRCVAQAIEDYINQLRSTHGNGWLEHARRPPTAGDIEWIRARAVETLYTFTAGAHPNLACLAAIDGVLALQLLTPSEPAPWRRATSWEEPK